MSAAAIYFLYFLSGFAALVYQVVWVRSFGNVFGNTVYSAAIVTAVFLCGLGVGSYCVGRWSDRHYRWDPGTPLRAYGLFEIGIGALALLVALIVPSLGELSAAISSYELAPEGWYRLTAVSHLGRFAVAVVMLAPITFLMGGTLTLLVRHRVTGDLSVAGWRIGALFGINTAGSALGAFATDFALIPELGIFRTQALAVALNVVAGTGAVALAGRPRRAVAQEAGATEAPGPVQSSDRGFGRRQVRLTGLTLILTGTAAIGMELVWLRYLISVIGGYRAAFSLLLTVILTGIFLGSLLGGFLHRRLGRAVLLFCSAQTLFVLTLLLQLAFFDPASTAQMLQQLQAPYRSASPLGRLAIEAYYNLWPILHLLGAPALFMGLAFPLANASVQRVEEDVGHRAGTLYLANTFGNVVGSLLTGFFLLPLLGIQRSVAALAACGAAALVPLYRSVARAARSDPGDRLLRPVFASCIFALVLALGAWVVLLPRQRLLERMVGYGYSPGMPRRVIALREGVNESLAVLEFLGGVRRLITNGMPMSSTSPRAMRYMRLFAHLPLLHMEEPKAALVICFGVGNTVHAASLHPTVEQLEAVELSENVVAHAHHFNRTNGGILEDPRLRVFINDGRQHLRMQPEGRYDLVTLEPPPISQAGVAALYAREFYALARSRLKPGGFLTQWLPAYQISPDAVLAVIRAFIEVFPRSVLLSGYGPELILMGVNGDSLVLDLDRVVEKLDANPELAADLRRIQVESLTALVGTFAAGPQTLASVTRDTPPVTDDRPVMEYSARSQLYEPRLSGEIFNVAEVHDWCLDCFETERGAERTPGLWDYLQVLATCYRSRSFLELTGRPPAVSGHLPSFAGARAAINGSAYLKQVFAGPVDAGNLGERFAFPCAPLK